MKYFVVEPLTLKKSHESVTFPIGKILELSQDQAIRLAGKVKPIQEPAKKICYWCRSTDFWISKYGRTICRVCHPPAPGAEVTK